MSSRLDELAQEFRSLKDRWEHKQISATKYLETITAIADEYIQILDSFEPPQPQVVEVPAR